MPEDIANIFVAELTRTFIPLAEIALRLALAAVPARQAMVRIDAIVWDTEIESAAP